MKRFLLPLIVILDPYSNIDYDQLTAYEFTQESRVEIVETLGDGYEKEVSEPVEIYIPRFLYNYPPSHLQHLNFPL